MEQEKSFIEKYDPFYARYMLVAIGVLGLSAFAINTGLAVASAIV